MSSLSHIRAKLGAQIENGENTRGTKPGCVVQDCCVSRNPRGGVVMSEKLHHHYIFCKRETPHIWDPWQKTSFTYYQDFCVFCFFDLFLLEPISQRFVHRLTLSPNRVVRVRFSETFPKFASLFV